MALLNVILTRCFLSVNYRCERKEHEEQEFHFYLLFFPILSNDIVALVQIRLINGIHSSTIYIEKERSRRIDWNAQREVLKEEHNFPFQ